MPERCHVVAKQDSPLDSKGRERTGVECRNGWQSRRREIQALGWHDGGRARLPAIPILGCSEIGEA